MPVPSIMSEYDMFTTYKSTKTVKAEVNQIIKKLNRDNLVSLFGCARGLLKYQEKSQIEGRND